MSAHERSPVDVVVLGATWETVEVSDVVDALTRAGATAHGGRPLGVLRGCVAGQPVDPAVARALDRRGIAVLGSVEDVDADRLDADDLGWVLAGAAPLRLPDVGWISLVHPSAVLGTDVDVGPGTVVGAGTSVGTGARLGRRVWLGAQVTVGHDTVVEDDARVLAGAVVSGTCLVAAGAVVGEAATVLQQLTVGTGASVLPGGVVTRNVPDGAQVGGVPARPVEAPVAT